MSRKTKHNPINQWLLYCASHFFGISYPEFRYYRKIGYWKCGKFESTQQGVIVARSKKDNKNKDGFLQKHGAFSGAVGVVITSIVALLIHFSSDKKPTISQINNGESTGIINTGPVTYSGLPQNKYNSLLEKLDGDSRMLNNLLDQLNVKDTTIFELTENIEKAQERIKDLLANESISSEVKRLIKEGRLVEAEQLVDRHYDEQVEGEEKTLAAKLYERAAIKDLRLKYLEARANYEKAALLQPENSAYQNQAGAINHTLGQYDKAIGYYELALASFIKILGPNHPNSKIVADNLAAAKRRFVLQRSNGTS